MSAFTVTNACVGCGACIATCPERAFRAVRPARAGDPPLVVLAARCTGCGECAEVCPVDACVEYAGGRGTEGEGERQRAGGRGTEGEGERQRAGGRGAL